MTNQTEALAALDYIEAQTTHLSSIPPAKFDRIRAAISSQPPAPSPVELPDDGELEAWRSAADDLLRVGGSVERRGAHLLQNAYLFANSLRASLTGTESTGGKE